MKNKLLFILVLILLFIGIIAIIMGCTNINQNKENGKIQVITTLFPQYDFVKKVGGDKVNTTLLLPPGTESHTYEPTPRDMALINDSNLFVYTGSEMEPWADNLISGIEENINVLDLSASINLIHAEEFEEKHYMEEEEYEHEEEEHEHEEEEHEHAYDPHFWLNPLYAIKMVESIRDELCKIDPDNSEYYTANAASYIQEIQTLDSEFEQTVASSSNPKIAFGGAFAYAYFVERYNLEFISAYSACGENVEPSTTQLKNVINYINENKIPVVFYKEYTNGNVAQTISESTGTQTLVFNTVHNVSKEEIANGASYISIMKQNLANLKIALGVKN